MGAKKGPQSAKENQTNHFNGALRKLPHRALALWGGVSNPCVPQLLLGQGEYACAGLDMEVERIRWSSACLNFRDLWLSVVSRAKPLHMCVP